MTQSNNVSLISNPIILNLICGLLGSIVGAFIAGRVTFKAMLKEKQYFIEIQIIYEKILSPLLCITYKLIERESMVSRVVSDAIYSEIENIIKPNIFWFPCINDDIKSTLMDIREYCHKRDEEKLVLKLKYLKEKLESDIKKYKYN